MKIDKKYIIIGVCILIGGVLTAALAFIGPEIITNGNINPNNVVTGNLSLKVTDTSVSIDNMAPIRSSSYETSAYKKEFTISSSESTLNGCMKLYLNFTSISDQLKSEYLVYKLESSTGNVSEGSFDKIENNKLLIFDSDFIEAGKNVTYNLYIWLRYVEDPSINLKDLLGISMNAYVSVSGSDTKESSSCIFDDTNKISYVVTLMNDDDKTVLESRKVKSGSKLGTISVNGKYYTKVNGEGNEYTSESIIDNDIMLYVMMEPNSFSTDSWKTIINAVRNNNISKYNLGDTKEIDLGDYGTHTVRVANTTTPTECSTEGFSQTACGFVIEFADIITTHYMNPSGTYKGKTYNNGWNVGGWPASSMYTFVNNDIFNTLPSDLRSVIIDTIVVSSHGSSDTDNFISTDKLYLLSGKEIYEDFADEKDTSKDLTRQLDYYKQEGVNTSKYEKVAKMYGKTALDWWFRSAGRYDGCFYCANRTGKLYNNIYAISNIGVSPAFRIG